MTQRPSVFFVLLLLLALLLATRPAQATHIVGGELTYTCLGDNNYEITLTVYRDCFFGNPAAYFDNPASVGVFNANNQLLWDIRIPLMGDDTLSPILTNECLVVPPAVCVHTTTYRTVVNLPPIIGGYQLAYQRCCRNQTIANIVDPLGTGATFGVVITERALLECNSSPQFNTWPPIYICANLPLVVDQSAFDIDGDSIVYRLCDPREGATPSIPQPQPPNAPPYGTVTWVSPPYGVNNMLNGSPGGEPLQIDSQTGLLTAVPNTIGQFVVAICVEEYRDGELISTTRRDFQYNVGVCGIITSAFSAPALQCGDLSVAFSNGSIGTTAFRWEFNDPANPGATSFLPNPVYTYADTGRYTVRLIAAPGSICADTFEQEIYLQYNSLFPDFASEIVECGDSVVLQFTDQTTDTLSTPVQWSWQTTTGQSSTNPNPVFVFNESGQVTVKLTVTAENGCIQSESRLIDIELIEADLGPDSLYLCPGDSVQLNAGYNPGYVFEWTPAPGLDDPNDPDPVVQPDETTTYQVSVRNADGSCAVERRVTVVVLPALTVTAPPDTITCAAEITLTATSNNALQYVWSTSPNFATILGTTASLTVSQIGEEVYYVLARDPGGCLAFDSVRVNSQAVNIFPLSTPFTCLGNFVAIGVSNQDPTDVLTYDWSPDAQIVLLGNTATPVVRPIAAGYQSFFVEAANQYGCIALDTVRVFAIDTANAEAAVRVLQCGSFEVEFASSSPNGLLYTWQFGDASQPGATGSGPVVRHTYPGPGIYTVTAALPTALPCADSLRLELVLGEPDIVPAFDWAYESCSDTAVVVFNNTSTNGQSMITGVEWNFGNGQSSNASNPELVLTATTNLEVELIITSSDGCIDSITQLVNILVPELELPDTLAACAGQGVYLNPDGDASYDYVWTPADGLDDALAANPLATPGMPVTYRVTATLPGTPCQLERSVYVAPAPALTANVPEDTLYCGGELVLFADASRPASVVWATDANFDNVVGEEPELIVNPGGDAIYYVRLTDNFGCTATDSVRVKDEGIRVLVTPPATICVGDTAILQGINIGESPVTFIWGPEAAILSDDGQGGVLVSPVVSTIYTLQAFNDFGCAFDTTVLLNIFNYVPPLSIFPAVDTVFLGESVQLTATQDAGYSYLWQPPTGLNLSTVFNPVATPEATTLYELVVRDPNGCTNSAQALVVVVEPVCREPYLFIPNAFTPNGDNLNDVLMVLGAQIEALHLMIYDRWGELIFETRDPGQGWDGRFRGKELPADVYGFYLEVRCIGGEAYIKTGNVTLLR